ncbi:MAG: Gfo/Idh/MocA family oxidoreductase [Verrucomicrobiota bacterium]
MKKTTRRQFMSTASAAVAASALPRFSIASTDQASKINVALVGIGGMGRYAVGEAVEENLVALCDVDEERGGAAFREHPQVPRFKDFRVMLDKMGNDIDAVAISTPDHTHFAPAMAAMELGKHVFIQKPLAHNIWEVRTLQKAAKQYGVISQMGNQGHTFDGMLRIKEWVDAGVIGDVTEVITWTNRPNPPWFIPPDTFPPPPSPVPATLDWDLWQGPVAARPFSDAYAPVRWRGWWDYGCGSLGDIGCHTFDAPFWVLDLGLPTKVEVEQDAPPGEGFIPMSSVVTYHFPARGDKPPVTMKWFEKGRDVPVPKRWDSKIPLSEKGGMYMEGSKETLYHADMRPTSPRLTPDDRFNDLKAALNEIDRMENQGKGGPIKEWFRAIKGEGPAPGSNFDYAGPLTEVVLLGAMAQRTGKTIEWDAETMSVKGQPELDVIIKEPVREGWAYGESLT